VSLVHRLKWDRVDIIGDIHGEVDALRSLLSHLGCDAERARVERPIVFVGDLVDRGPDSIAVVELVQHLIASGVAQAVLGNHELNIVANDPKEGNGWFFGHEDHWHTEPEGKTIPFESRRAAPEEVHQWKMEDARTRSLVGNG
jgi:hypothetical protein